MNNLNHSRTLLAWLFAAVLLPAVDEISSAATHYVDVNSTNATPPYTNWATAATNIQDAVDAAVAGEEIVVTNGLYAGGLLVNKALRVQSVNGPQFTTIAGGGPCVSLASNTSLSGFTVTGGLSLYTGGGLYCASPSAEVSNCLIEGNCVINLYTQSGTSGICSGDAYGGGAYGGTLNNCTLAYNSAQICVSGTGPVPRAYAGGAYGGVLNNCTLTGNIAGYYGTGGAAHHCTLNNCTLSGNSAGNGGGASDSTLNNCTLTENTVNNGDNGSGGGALNSTLNNCTLTANSAHYDGGGAWGSTLDNCTLKGNSAAFGGGVSGGALNNCTLTGNTASRYYGLAGYLGSGGGAYLSTLANCALTGNSAVNGGGAGASTLNNCTLTGNSGGGAIGCTLTNCIAYFNTGSNYDTSSTLNYSCTTPLPNNGVGNISSDPQLASASRLSAFSPCIGKGNYATLSGTDIDGEPWANPPSIGCDEYHAGAVTGPLSVAISASFTNVAVGYPVAFTGLIEGRTDLSVWTFGDGALEINEPYAAHSWAMPGDYTVSLWCFSDSYPGGISATVAVRVVGPHYVAANSPNPTAPYTSWATAATNIQDAIAAATEPGPVIVLVTNGTYAPIFASGPVSVRSINGAQFTLINGGHAARCATLTNNASLSGFTLTNGVSQYGAGAYGGTLNNCVLSGNSASSYGGGASSSTLNNCTLNGNSATAYGGGAYYASLSNCTLKGNSADANGGGVYGGTLSNCMLIGNSSGVGGGAISATLNNCILGGNSADLEGGGAYHSTLNNCTLTANTVSDPHGGGGGAYYSTLNNCIVSFNTAPEGANYDSLSTLNYCCTTPLPTNGVGNIALDPQLASDSHLSAGSPCRGAGNAAYASGTDIDGEAWSTPPSIGCDEYHAGAVTGPLSVAIAAYTYVKAGYLMGLTGLIQGRTTGSVWDFGDGTTATNQPYASHAWAFPGEYPLVLRAYNESWPGGISATAMVRVAVQPTHYVASENPNPVPPYTSWATAATNIQDAVDWAAPASVVYVTNGIYATGGRQANRVEVDKPLSLRSINGPQFTTISGQYIVRCIYLTNGASLSGFTLSHGYASVGGGVASGVAAGGTLNDCMLSANSAYYGGAAAWCTLTNCALVGNGAGNEGGGAYNSTLNNCTLSGNSVGPYGYGGGASHGTLNNCTLSGNWCGSYGYGGGTYACALNNCIAYFNTAQGGPNYWSDLYGVSILNHCCTMPQPASGAGNITNAPLFVDQAGGNLRLQSNSPCINAGSNAYTVGGTDLDGRPRIVGGTVDMGAYEFQPGVSGGFIGYLQQYGLSTDGSADFADSDGDGADNWQEWIAGTDPTNAFSALRLLAPLAVGTNVIVTWQSIAGVSYFLESSSSSAPLAFAPLATNIPGQPGTTSFTDTNIVSSEARFYRVGVSGQ
jgi:hypothetical protein